LAKKPRLVFGGITGAVEKVVKSQCFNLVLFIALQLELFFLKERCVLAITANDLKRNGISGIERAMKDSDDHHVLVDVRGRAKYVILAVEEFNLFREYQLDKAISEAEKCLAAGD